MANEFKVKKGLVVDGSGTVVDIQGTAGQLFSVTDSLQGDIFSVSDVSGVPILNVNSSGLVTLDGSLKLNDNNYIYLGNDDDLQIYHNGTHSYIDGTTTGDLYIRSINDDVVIQGADDVFVYAQGGQDAMIARGGGAVELYYANGKKFETSATGATFTSKLLQTAHSTAVSNASYNSEAAVVAQATQSPANAYPGFGFHKGGVLGVFLYATSRSRLKQRGDGGQDYDIWNSNDGVVVTTGAQTFSGNKTFTGDISYSGTLTSTGSTTVPAYFRSTANVSYIQLQNSATGTSGTSDGLTVGVNGTSAYVWNREQANLFLGTDDTTAVTIDSSQNMTVVGNISASNLSGTNTGDQVLPTDFVSKANGGTFTGNVNIYTGAGSAEFNIGRNNQERLQVYQDDLNTTLTADNDSDNNSAHSFILNRTFAGSGDNNFIVQKDGTAQFTIDKDANVDFTGSVGVGVAGGSNAKLEVVATSGEVFRADAASGAFRIVANQTQVATQGIFSHTGGNASFGNNVTVTGNFTRSNRLSVTGDVNVIGATDLTIPQTRKLLFDGAGGHTYISEAADSNLKFYVAGTEVANFTNDNINFQKNVSIHTSTTPRFQLDLAKLNNASQTDYLALGVNNGPSAGNGTAFGTGLVWKANYSGYTKRSAGIVQTAEGNYFRSGLAFFTNNQESTSSDWVERMRLNMDGKLTLDPGAGVATNGTVLDVQGSEGQLFSVTNSLSGDLFSVSDVSGVPILNVNSSGDVDIDGDLNITDLIYHKGGGTPQSFFGFAHDGDLRFSVDGSDKMHIDSQGVDVTSNLETRHILANADSTYDIGSNSVRYRNIYADTLYGDGSNLTGVGGSDNTKLPLAGGTMSGDISLGAAVNASIQKTAGGGNGNFAAVELFSSGTADTGAAIAIQQQTNEGDTIIFADYEPHVEWGISAENGANEIHFTAGNATGSLGTKTFRNNSGTARTAYKKVIVNLSNGNMLVGGTLGVGTSTVSYALDVSGTIRATSDVIAFSDKRVKENIKTIDNALDKVTKLRGVSYNRKDTEDKSTKIGVIAQEVEKILPEVVETDEKGLKSVAYGNVVGVLIEAVKELTAEVEQLKKQIK